MQIEFLKQVDSTNRWLKSQIKMRDLNEGFVIRTDYQTAGRGQIDTVWESERAKNLLFSLVLMPENLSVHQQFLISQLVSVAICRCLETYLKQVKIKWPNDIYVGDKKIAGVLIENSWMGDRVKSSVVGIGLNVNQTKFKSNAPNPISMKNLLGKSINRTIVLTQILEQIRILYSAEEELVELEYFERLYRSNDYYPYHDADGNFKAKIANVKSDGQLELETPSGHRKYYYFKEVEFVI